MTEGYKFKINETEKLDNGCRYKVSLELPMKDGWFEDVYFCVQRGRDLIPIKLKHKENKDGIVYFETEEDIFLETRAIYKYYFSYKCDGFRRFVKENDVIGPDGIALEEMYNMSVNFKAPDWAKGRMMYHIFVDRFNRGSSEKMVPMDRRNIHEDWNESMQIGPDKDGIWNNDFYGGDLKGIIDKLDYIESLGVSILYLSPIVWSQSNHRYDTSDYEKVDPYAGVNEDLKLLCEEAHKRGMKVVLDAVFNHTGSDSKYFNKFGSFDDVGAYQSNESPYSSFFRKHYHDGKEYFDYCISAVIITMIFFNY